MGFCLIPNVWITFEKNKVVYYFTVDYLFNTGKIEMDYLVVTSFAPPRGEDWIYGISHILGPRCHKIYLSVLRLHMLFIVRKRIRSKNGAPVHLGKLLKYWWGRLNIKPFLNH